MNRLNFNQGEIIFKEGDSADCMYDIVSGKVGVYVGYGTENEKRLTVLGDGQFLGEMGLIESYPRSATAVAEENDTCLEEIGEKDFSGYFTQNSDRLLLIMRQLSQRLREQTEEFEAASKVLDEMTGTHDTRDQRSPSLLEKARALLKIYKSKFGSVN